MGAGRSFSQTLPRTLCRGQAHRHPDLWPRLQHASHRAHMRGGWLAGAGGGGDRESAASRRAALCRRARHRDCGGRSSRVRQARSVRCLAGRNDRCAPARSGRAGRLHAHPRCGIRAALRGPDAQHPSVAAAGVPRPAHAPARVGGGLQGQRRHGALRDARSRPRTDRDAVGGAGAARRHRRQPGCARAGHRAPHLSAGRAWFVHGQLRLHDGLVRQADGAAQLLLQ